MRLALALQVAGLVCLTVGAGLLAPWLGLIVAGLALVLVGIANERGA